MCVFSCLFAFLPISYFCTLCVGICVFNFVFILHLYAIFIRSEESADDIVKLFENKQKVSELLADKASLTSSRTTYLLFLKMFT